MAFVLQLSDDTGRVIDFISASYALEEQGFAMQPPDKKNIEAGPSFYIHGQRIVSTTYGNRNISITFEVTGATREIVGQRIAVIEQILERARQRQEMVNSGFSVELKFQIDGMTSPSYFRVLDGEFSLPRNLMSASGVHWKDGNNYKIKGCGLQLICEPFAYSASPHLTWEDSSGDRPSEVGLRNSNTAGAYSTGGIQVDNGKDSTRDNVANLLASSVGGDQNAATVLILENDSPDFEDFGKVYVGAALGIEYFTLSGAIDNSQTTITVDEDLSPYKVPINLLIDSEELLATSLNKTTRQLTVTRGHNSTTPASHSDNAVLKNLSMNPMLDSSDGDYTGLSSPDTYTNFALPGALGGSYYEVEFTGSATKDLVTWTMTKDQVAAQQGLVRIFGRLSAQAGAGVAAYRYWTQKCLYRLVFRYISRSGGDPIIHTTPWVTPLDATTQLLDFASVRIPPYGVAGQDQVSQISVTIQAKLKALYVADTVGLNIDYLMLLPIEYGYRAMETRGEGLARGDKIVDDGWKGIAYVEQIASYPSGASLGKASIINAYMSPVWLQPGFDQRLYFIQESDSGIADPGRRFDVRLYAVNTFLNLVA